MATKLTKKEKKFVAAYADTGNGTQAALKVYDTSDPNTAGVIAYENLRKPKILDALNAINTDERLEDKHNELLNSSTLEKLSFDDDEDDDVITQVVSQLPGYKLLYIRRNLSQNGEVLSCYAYVSAPNDLIQDKALDKAYKLKGAYAPEKHANLNITVEAEPGDVDLDALIVNAEAALKAQKLNG